MTNQAALIVLRYTRELIASGWTKRFNARNIAGRGVLYRPWGVDGPVPVQPVCWCLTGAIHSALGRFTNHHQLRPQDEVFLPLGTLLLIARARAMAQAKGTRVYFPAGWLRNPAGSLLLANDYTRTCQSDVLLWLDIAIESMTLRSDRKGLAFMPNHGFDWQDHISPSGVITKGVDE